MNLRKVALYIKEEYIDNDVVIGPDALNQIVKDSYNKFLDETRKQVLKFFKVPNTNDVKAKVLVRIYVFTLKKDDPVKKQYEHFSKVLNNVEENFRNKIIPEEFLDSGFIDEPKDVYFILFII